MRRFDLLCRLCAVWLCCACVLPACAQEQVAPETGPRLLTTGFALARPANWGDVDDPAQGVPRMLGVRLQMQGVQVLHTPELLSWDWQPGPVAPALLAEVGQRHAVRFVLAGVLREGGIVTVPWLWGLWSRQQRDFTLELSLYDTRQARLVWQTRLSSMARGDVQLGRDYAFGSAAFYARPSGQALGNLIEQAAMQLGSVLQVQPVRE